MKYSLPISAVFLLICSSTYAQSEVEPNNSTSTANPLAQGSSVSGELCPGDEDYFLLSAPATHKLTVTVAASVPNGTTNGVRVELLDNTGSLLKEKISSAGLWGQTTVNEYEDFCFLGQGEYFKLSGGSDCVTYTFSIGTSSPPVFSADAEPNEVPFIATPINFGQTIEGQLRLDPMDAQDHYRVHSPGRGIMRFYAESEWSSINPAELGFRVTDSLNLQPNTGILAPTVVDVGTSGISNADTSRSTCVGAGTYDISVEDPTGKCGFSYKFRVEFEPMIFSNDPEPNNDTTTAIPIAAGVWGEGQNNHFDLDHQLDDLGDVWKIYKPYFGPLVVYTEATDYITPVIPSEDWICFQVYDENFAWIELNPSTDCPKTGYEGSIVSDTTIVADPEALPAGTYYIVFTRASQLCHSYRFSYSATPVTIEENLTQPQLFVMPNPSADVFTFHARGMEQLVITDALGRVVERIRTGSQLQATWDSGDHAKGTYIATAMLSDGKTANTRVIKN